MLQCMYRLQVWLNCLKKKKKKKNLRVILKSRKVITQRMFHPPPVQRPYILGNNWACAFKPSIPYMAGAASVFRIFSFPFHFFLFFSPFSFFFLSFFFSFFFLSRRRLSHGHGSRVLSFLVTAHIFTNVFDCTRSIHVCPPTHHPTCICILSLLPPSFLLDDESNNFSKSIFFILRDFLLINVYYSLFQFDYSNGHWREVVEKLLGLIQNFTTSEIFPFSKSIVYLFNFQLSRSCFIQFSKNCWFNLISYRFFFYFYYSVYLITLRLINCRTFIDFLDSSNNFFTEKLTLFHDYYMCPIIYPFMHPFWSLLFIPLPSYYLKYYNNSLYESLKRPRGPFPTSSSQFP